MGATTETEIETSASPFGGVTTPSPVAGAADDDSATVDGDVNTQVSTTSAAAAAGYVSNLSVVFEISSTPATLPERRQLAVAETTPTSTRLERQQETSDAWDWTTTATKAPSVVDTLDLESTSSTIVNRSNVIDDRSFDDGIASTSVVASSSTTSDDAIGKDRMPQHIGRTGYPSIGRIP